MRLRVWLESPEGKRLGGLANWLFIAAVSAYLLWKLSQIGWPELLASVPAQPLFYLLFLPRFLLIPLVEVAIYRLVWQQPMLPHWRVFLRKYAYNFGVLDYAGEAYFGLWARRTLDLPQGRVLTAIKDVNILSALVSHIAALALLLGLTGFGQMELIREAAPQAVPYFLLAGGFVLLLTVLTLVFRRQLFGLTARESQAVIGLHTGRVLLSAFLQALQWAVALPLVGWEVWLVFVTTFIVLSRLPMIPNKQMVFVGLTLALTQIVDAPEAQVAAVFLASSAILQVMYFAAYLATSWVGEGLHGVAGQAVTPASAEVRARSSG